jgi:hypothetical protein
MKNKYIFTLLKALAFFIPFYFVYYGPLYEKSEMTQMRILWKYVLLGFLAYVLLFVFV